MALFPLLALVCLLAAAPANAALPALRADGARIVDTDGREVLLRGAELTRPVSRRVIQATGWNVVRVRLSMTKLVRAERLVDELAEDGVYTILVPPDAPLGLGDVAARFATRPHVLGFEGLPVPGKLLFNPAVVTSPGLVFAPSVSAVDELQGAREAGGPAPVVVSWPAATDPGRFLGAADGLRLGAIATGLGLVDPRGPLARAYVRAAPGRLDFAHYDEARGHFATRGVSHRANIVPVEIFYPGAKHRDARFRARGLSDLVARRLPGGGRLITGIPHGRWSFQIGPSLA